MAHILIVEDELPLRRALHDRLVSEGHEVSTANNGKVGLEMAQEKKPDLILLDIIMPIMDGMSMLRELRKKEWGKAIPVILLTNLVTNEEVEKAVEEGAYDYLVKTDWSLEEVMRIVSKKLKE